MNCGTHRACRAQHRRDARDSGPPLIDRNLRWLNGRRALGSNAPAGTEPGAHPRGGSRLR